jgi:hypothetical protein
MRFHKARKISKPEADFVIDTAGSSRNALVVISHHDAWYDVRSLTEKELDEFFADLLRADITALRSGCITPH